MSDLLENFVVFMLDIRLWSGCRALRPEDLAVGGIDPDTLPPGTLASLGSKRIIGKEALAPFAALKREAEKLCLAKGIRFLGGYAIPSEDAADLTTGLDRLQEQFAQTRQAFLTRYDSEIQSWIAENPPQWEPIIRRAVAPAASVGRALQFAYTPISISAPDGLSGTWLDRQAQGLFGQLCHEIRQMASSAFRASYLNKAKVTRKALRPIHAIRQKLTGLCFIDPQIPETIDAIDAALNAVPANGPLQGNTLNLLAGLLGRQLAQLGRAPAQEHEDDTELAVDADDEDEQMPMAACGGPRSLAWDF